MSRLSELVGKGVRLIVADNQGAEASSSTTSEESAGGREISKDEFADATPKVVEHSEVAADVADFGAVYSEAGIELPAHGYGIDKVAEMLEGKRLAGLSREVKATAVMAAVEAAGAPITDVLQDAVRRDRALDAFEAAKADEVKELRMKAEVKIASIQQEMDAFLREKNAEMESLKEAVAAAERAFVTLQGRKRREEDRLHDLVAHFVEGTENPITAGSGGAAPTPPAPAGNPSAR
jgi:hypothetical protein